MDICYTGLDECELTYLSRFCDGIGLRLTLGLKKGATSHLICHNTTTKKHKMAVTWKIPLVDLTWVYSLGKVETPSSSEHSITDVTNGISYPNG